MSSVGEWVVLGLNPSPENVEMKTKGSKTESERVKQEQEDLSNISEREKESNTQKLYYYIIYYFIIYYVIMYDNSIVFI